MASTTYILSNNSSTVNAVIGTGDTTITSVVLGDIYIFPNLPVGNTGNVTLKLDAIAAHGVILPGNYQIPPGLLVAGETTIFTPVSTTVFQLVSGGRIVKPLATLEQKYYSQLLTAFIGSQANTPARMFDTTTVANSERKIVLDYLKVLAAAMNTKGGSQMSETESWFGNMVANYIASDRDALEYMRRDLAYQTQVLDTLHSMAGEAVTTFAAA